MPSASPAGDVAPGDAHGAVGPQRDRGGTTTQDQLLLGLDHVSATEVDIGRAVDLDLQLVELGLGLVRLWLGLWEIGQRGQAHDDRRIRTSFEEAEQDRPSLASRRFELLGWHVTEHPSDRWRTHQSRERDTGVTVGIDGHNPGKAGLSGRRWLARVEAQVGSGTGSVGHSRMVAD
jgi:hypothetical protein